MKKQISVVTRVTRHSLQCPRLVTIPLDAIEPWKLTATTTVEGTINGTELGRRSLNRGTTETAGGIKTSKPADAVRKSFLSEPQLEIS